MPYAFPPEIKQLVDQNLASGRYASEDEVLHAALHVLSDYEATILDVRRGQIDFEEGHGEDLSKAMADIRRQLRDKT